MSDIREHLDKILEFKSDDWFLFNEQTRDVARFTNGEIIAYDWIEALEDITFHEVIIQFDRLPTELKLEFINQRNSYESNNPKL